MTVLRSGRVIETGSTIDVLSNPREDYTKALMAAVPRLDKRLEYFSNIVGEDERSNDDRNWSIEGATDNLATDWLLADDATSQQLKGINNVNKPLLSVSDLQVSFELAGTDSFGGGLLNRASVFHALNLSLIHI